MQKDDDDDDGGDGVDEFLIPPALLDKIAALLGWTKLVSENFHEFYDRYAVKRAGAPGAGGAITKMVNWRGTFSKDEWEVAGVVLIEMG